jgi:hypothetical protein
MHRNEEIFFIDACGLYIVVFVFLIRLSWILNIQVQLCALCAYMPSHMITRESAETLHLCLHIKKS